MGNDRVAILCTGDLHLGRRSSRVALDEHTFSVTHVWESIVDQAIQRRVDAVALTGDVVDRDNRYYEAIGPLERGVRRLGERGIPTYAVSGNHDFDVLPRLIDVVGVDSFHLLGRDGKWELQTLERDGEPVLEIAGWSFPSEHYHRSPLADFDDLDDAGVPRVGMLHADLDQPSSPYAPVTRGELEQHAMAVWLLGHIHLPQERRTASDDLILYPGSPQALDPGERGPHGPWLINVSPGVRPTAQQIPLATVRYRELGIDLDGVDTEDDFQRVVPDRIAEDLANLADGAGALERVVYRLGLQGRTALHRELFGLSSSLLGNFERSFGRITAGVDKAEIQTRPKVDLDELSRGQDPPAVLASLLREIETGEISEERRPLFQRLRAQLSDLHRCNAYSPLRGERDTARAPDEEEVRRFVLLEGMTLLDEMLAQKRREASNV